MIPKSDCSPYLLPKVCAAVRTESSDAVSRTRYSNRSSQFPPMLCTMSLTASCPRSGSRDPKMTWVLGHSERRRSQMATRDKEAVAKQQGGIKMDEKMETRINIRDCHVHCMCYAPLPIPLFPPVTRMRFIEDDEDMAMQLSI